MQQKSKMVNFRTTESGYVLMKEFADFNGQSMSEMVNEAVWEKIENWDDLATLREYKAELADGRLETIPWAQVKEEAGL